MFGVSEKIEALAERSKVVSYLWVAVRIFGILGAIYFFMCSLSFLTSASLILLGKEGSSFFSQSTFLSNQPVGLMIGVFATVLFQSSSTTTSIIVALVGADVIGVPQAVPMVMGANIGTSVTNTFVSIGQIGVREDFRRAFAAATVHDMFNWLTVLVLLPLEMASGYLEILSKAIVDSFELNSSAEEIELVEKITKPFTNLIIQIDKKVFTGWSSNDTTYENYTTLLKSECERNVTINGTIEEESYQCGYLFAECGWSEVAIGVCVLIIALAMLVGCLGVLVKVLNSLMKAKMVDFIKTKLNGELPYVPWLTGYVALLIGAGITFVIQSSSVFTSTLTPLVGAGIFSIERAYVLTLGSNIGTCGTSLLAALTVSGRDALQNSLQIALCHLFFNVTGIILFYPVPFMRWPIAMAQTLGRTVAEYRWFAFFYLVMMFFALPGYVMGLSFIDEENHLGVYLGFFPLVLLLLIIVLINVLQDKRPKYLPKFLRNWDFLPLWMRSLEPLDRIFSKCSCCNKNENEEDDEIELKISKTGEDSQSQDKINL